ncbi:hypothetical protein KO481_02635 [Nocardia sp. NEAU-G5]|uniref:Uncharacterized protein n=1 Tax=Nocardia albiluteola TaxID=2842303 RepID=A0ABS6ATS0_9NOCA|nr:DUF6071 family protein [Nocardia albiluteola]MBU3060418.1 hypothetical protein [Nocardia albiluteola]
MIRLLVTNGCSCAVGKEMEHPARDGWPVVLAESLGVELVNLARNGSSNRRIIRTLVEQLPTVIKQSGYAPDEIMTLVSWSETSRHEHYVGKKRSLRRFNVGDPFHDGWQRIGSWRVAEGHKGSIAFYDHLWNDDGQLANHFLDWLMLDALLRDTGVHPRYNFAFPIPRELPAPAVVAAEQLDQTRTFGGIPPRPGTCFLEMPAEFERGPGGHSLEEGHRWFAGQLRTWLESDQSLPLPSRETS